MVENKELELELERKYRKYTIIKMTECFNDASEIVAKEYDTWEKYDDKAKRAELTAIATIATKLFQARISPFHFWRPKELVKITEADENQLTAGEEGGIKNSPQKEE